MWCIGAGKGRHGRVEEDGKTYSSVWTPPHFLQFELLHALLVGGDGCALDTDVVLQDGIGSVDGNLVVGLYEVVRIEDLRGGSSEKERSTRSGTAITMGQVTNLIPVLQAQVVVLDVQLKIRQDKL